MAVWRRIDLKEWRNAAIKGLSQHYFLLISTGILRYTNGTALVRSLLNLRFSLNVSFFDTRRAT